MLELRQRAGNQDPDELARFIELVHEVGARRYLEVGCRNGDTFYAVMRAIGERGRGLAIDLPENPAARESLSSTVTELRLADMAADAIFANSQSEETIERVRQYGPFDLILIDADHRYAGARHDFDAYGDLAPVVALHDIASPPGNMSDGAPNGVPRLWSEIKASGRSCREIVTPGSGMGFGVLFR